MKPAKNKKYLAWIRTHECCVTANPTQVIAHHVQIGALRGISQKPTDYWAIPLDTFEHSRLHHVGEVEYWKKKDMNPHLIIKCFIDTWIDRNDLTVPFCDYICENVPDLSVQHPVIFWTRLYDKFLTEIHNS